MERFIYTNDDLYTMLDSFTRGADWEGMYKDRRMQAPFIVQNELPDENLVEFIGKYKGQIHNAVEFGCGEGRNSIYMAKQGIKVVSYDTSENAIKNAI